MAVLRSAAIACVVHNRECAVAERDGSAVTVSETLWFVTGLLVFEKRVSYRRLSVEFNLDSETIENVCQELAVKRLAFDENGEGLTWAAVGSSYRSVVVGLKGLG